VTVSGGDQVRFGADNPQRTTTNSPTTNVSSPSTVVAPTSNTNPSQPEQPAATKPKYGYYQNNVRAGFGFLFRDIVPLLLSLPLMGGIPGLIVAVACVPISYLSGKFGRHVAKDVDPNNLNRVFKYLSSVRNTLSGDPGSNNNQQSIVDRLNGALNDLLNIRPTDGWLKTWWKQGLRGMLFLTPGSRMANFFTAISNSRFLLRAEVNTRVAQENTVGGAGKAAVKGAAEWTFYSALSSIGNALSKCWWPLSWIGGMMKYAGLIKITSDTLSSTGNTAQAPATASASTAT
jgi:hypothetical protein